MPTSVAAMVLSLMVDGAGVARRPDSRDPAHQASGQDRVRCDPAGSWNWTPSRIDNGRRLTLPRMHLHPLAQGFADVADDYERGRPGYPAEAIAAIGLAAGARGADVGAGAGKLTRALVAFGFDVVAVEPLDGMRARLARELPEV